MRVNRQWASLAPPTAPLSRSQSISGDVNKDGPSRSEPGKTD